MNTRTLTLGACLSFCLLHASAATNEPVSLHMPDGQMRSHLLRIYVTADIQPGDKPELTLLTGKFLNQSPPGWTLQPIVPSEVARFQQWTEKRGEVTIGRTGTLLLVDLRGTKFTLKPWTRVTPVLKWGEPRQTVIGDRPVYIGNLIAAVVVAVLIVGSLMVLLCFFASRTEDDKKTRQGGWKRLLLNPEGRLSLSKTQAAFWTLCVITMLLCIGLTRLEVPAIPESLVALMALSLATRATIFVTEKKDSHSAATTGEEKPKADKPRLRDLIHSTGGDNPVAITKAQMVLWTCAAGFLFMMKSLLNGELWEVPWQLVTLMGISQASYVIPPVYEKSTKLNAGGTNTGTNPNPNR